MADVRIPVAERYGECENLTCYSRLNHYIPKKPVWHVESGQRLCNECYGAYRVVRRAQAVA